MTSTSKAAIRQRLRAARRQLDPAQRHAESAAVCAALASLDCDRPLAAYAATPDEVDPGALIGQRWAGGTTVLLPRVLGPGVLSWHAVHGPDDLIPGAFRLREPRPGLPALPLPPDLVLLVPGVGFSPDGRRIGQGGGFYDRVLVALPPNTLSIGLAFSCQIEPDLPQDPHDQRVQALNAGGIWVRPLPTT